MSRVTLRRTTLAVLLLAGFSPQFTATAATSRTTVRSHVSQDAHNSPSAVAGWWSALVHLWASEGCMLDPHGACAATSSGAGAISTPARTDEGCSIDPHGLCSPNS